jgi:hypothetical protein
VFVALASGGVVFAYLRLPAASLVAPAAFVVASEILLFGGWAVVWKLLAARAARNTTLTTSPRERRKKSGRSPKPAIPGGYQARPHE